MFLIPSYMALMALGQWGEQPCPMVVFSDQMCHPMPCFTPDLVWYQVILWKDHCFTPWFSSGSWDQHCWSNRPSCAQLMLRIVICGKNHLISVSLSFFPLLPIWFSVFEWWAVLEMYSPQRKDFVSLTLGDQHSHSYTNGKHRRQSCWRVSVWLFSS